MRRNRNRGVRKRCECPRNTWAKCAHGWYFNFKWKEVHYRLSLDREIGRRIEGRADAEAEADRIRNKIRDGTFRTQVPERPQVLTFDAFGRIWRERRGVHLVRPRDNEYRLNKIKAFVLPATDPPLTLGEKSLPAITTDDIEAFRDARKGEGLSSVTVNHDLKLLRKMFNWGIRKGFLERTPFKIGTEPAITLEKEIPRSRRFEHEDDEQKLLDSADPHLRAVLVALLDTACRVGEVLSLQWKDVNLERKEILVEAIKAKTRTARIVPISTRLRAVLEMRRLAHAGKEFGPEAYVFGNEVGEKIESIRETWEAARNAAGLSGLQLRDLRHEAGSRFDEAGVPTNYVSKLLGHTNLTTTSRYLNIHRRGLQLAMQKLERHQQEEQAARVAQALHTAGDSTPAVVPASDDDPAGKQLPS
jgi:integrase